MVLVVQVRSVQLSMHELLYGGFNLISSFFFFGYLCSCRPPRTCTDQHTRHQILSRTTYITVTPSLNFWHHVKNFRQMECYSMIGTDLFILTYQINVFISAVRAVPYIDSTCIKLQDNFSQKREYRDLKICLLIGKRISDYHATTYTNNDRAPNFQ